MTPLSAVLLIVAFIVAGVLVIRHRRRSDKQA
jgi:hypothetical protein